MMNPSRPYRALVASAAAAALLATAACSGDDDSSKKSTPPSTPASTATPAPSSSAPKAAAVDPLRGGKPSSNAVVGVKIDDTANGRPQYNIDKADVTYIEEVEGGLTRLLAVFHTNLPTVEPVRSVRPADPELLSQYGKVGFVASGGQKISLNRVDRSPLKSSINDRGGPGFQRTGHKSAPYNVSANLSLIAKKIKAAKARNVGFRWLSSTSWLKSAASGTRVRTVVGGTPIDFRYNARTKRYYRYIDGTLQRTAAGKPISTPNVLVQFCRVETFTKDRDVNGNPNKYTHTIGKGKVVLFRDGKKVTGTWSRSGLTRGTVFHRSGGASMPMKPGGAWVVLTRTGAPLG